MVGLVVGVRRVGNYGRGNIPEAVLHLGIEGLDVLPVSGWVMMGKIGISSVKKASSEVMK
jgi:hypothetical protein